MNALHFFFFFLRSLISCSSFTISVFSNFLILTSSQWSHQLVLGTPNPIITPNSHVTDRCRSQTILVADRCFVLSTPVLPATQIGTNPIHSKKWSEQISQWISHETEPRSEKINLKCWSYQRSQFWQMHYQRYC